VAVCRDEKERGRMEDERRGRNGAQVKLTECWEVMRWGEVGAMSIGGRVHVRDIVEIRLMRAA
jgi:hypothetical protein